MSKSYKATGDQRRIDKLWDEFLILFEDLTSGKIMEDFERALDRRL